MIITKRDLPELIKGLKGKTKKIVFTNGCFDILHMGHVDYINKAKALGDILIIGLNSDTSIRRIKGENRPIIDEKQRAYILDNLKAVDYVVLFEEDTPYDLIKNIQPDILVKGADYENKTVVGKDIVEENNGEVRLIEFIDGCSTSGIIERILKRHA